MTMGCPLCFKKWAPSAAPAGSEKCQQTTFASKRSPTEAALPFLLAVKRGLLGDESSDELFEPINCDLIQNRGLQPQIVRDLPVEGGALVASDRFRIRANPAALAGQLSSCEV
jgi:hypothetical protein